LQQFAISTPASEPTEIAPAPDGNVWFTQSGTNQVAALDPATGLISEITPVSVDSGPRGITDGADGNLWVAQVNSGQIGRIVPDLHVVMTTPLPGELSAGGAFGFTARVEYDSGALDTGYSGTLTVALANGPAGGALGGATTVMVAGGVATFAGLSFNRSGSYTLLTSGGDVAAALAGSVQVAGGSSMPSGTPTITGETVLTVGRGRHRQVVGLRLSFNQPLDAATARNPANYTVIETTSHSRAAAVRGLRVRIVYNRRTHSVKLILPGKPNFSGGGSLVVRGAPPMGISNTAGVFLDGNDQGASGDNAVFYILPDGQGIIR
jgi:hypothetical protein